VHSRAGTWSVFRQFYPSSVRAIDPMPLLAKDAMTSSNIFTLRLISDAVCRDQSKRWVVGGWSLGALTTVECMRSFELASVSIHSAFL